MSDREPVHPYGDTDRLALLTAKRLNDTNDAIRFVVHYLFEASGVDEDDDRLAPLREALTLLNLSEGRGGPA